jgi:hypothetical protein
VNMTDIRRDSPLFTQRLEVVLAGRGGGGQEEAGGQAQGLVLQLLPGTRQHSNGQQENFLHFEVSKGGESEGVRE